MQTKIGKFIICLLSVLGLLTLTAEGHAGVPLPPRLSLDGSIGNYTVGSRI